ncbi:MAG: DUF935 domain-containing protein [Thiohalospira sp.]
MAENESPTYDAIATTQDGRDVTRPYVDALELLDPEDSVLRAVGDGLRVYQALLRDDQVWSTFAQRRTAVTSREWEVQPGGRRRIDRAAADHLRDVLGQIAWDRITDRMLYGVFYGYAVGEVMWARDGRHITVDDIVVRNRRRFAYGTDGDLRLLTMTRPDGEPLPDRKFWTYEAGADHDDEPYGLGLGHALYWPAFFKREGMRAWLKFLDKFGQPTAVGKHGRNATPDERQRLLQALRAVHTDTGVTVPEGMTIELLEASRSGTADYTSLYDRMDRAITKVVLGQTMTTEDGSSRSQSQTHMDVRQDIVKSDADLVSASFNATVARWLTEWNYPGAATPAVWRILEDAEDLSERAKREEIVAKTSGLRPTQAHVESVYGGEWERPEPSAAPGPASPQPAFAEGDDPVEGPSDQLSRMGREAEPAVQDWVEKVDSMLAEVESLDEVGERMLALFPQLDTQDLADKLAEGLTAAELAGRSDEADEREGGDG